MARLVVLEDVDAATARETAAEHGQPLRVVTDAAGAADAVLAALDGVPVVVLAAADRDVIDQLCDDLQRLGDLDHRVGVQAKTPAALSRDERALLAALMAGASLGEAARALHLSRRTADRRLASARRALGAASTSEALVAARRAGIQPAGQR